jgi:tetratricopeptide (TPR) repeat protein
MSWLRVKGPAHSCGFWSALLLSAVLASCGGADNSTRVEQHKQLAGELQSNGLYQAALEEYAEVLALEEIGDEMRANMSYLMARIYYEDLKDYQNAAAFYLRAREYDPEGSFMPEASKNLVASLERLGNLIDAKRQLDAVTDIDHAADNPDDLPVAKIGSRSIWLSEIDQQISMLPPETQKQLLSRDARLEFIKQYVGVELLYNAAVREDYLSDPELQRQKEQLIKRLVVDRFVAGKVVSQERPDTLDVRNFYRANRDSLYNGAPFDSVRARVYFDYQTEKAEASYRDYIARLAASEQVEFLDQNVK